MSLPTGTITFLFTDIEGSTKLWEAHPEAMRAAVARHDALLRQAVADSDGYLFKTTGDGIAAAFALATDALAAALAAQVALFAEPWPEQTVLRSRMGLHTGAAELRDGDYFGTALNRCARLTAAGHGGQTLLSDVTYELTRDTLPENVSLLSLGAQRLKDLERPEHVYQLTHPALPESFAPLRTLDATPNNLPQQVTSFIGCEAAIADVTGLLGRTRLLTLTGSGGSGKTRLSLQAAADVLDGYPDGAWQVELAPLADPALVPQTVATALGLKEQVGQSLTQTLTGHLKDRALLLLLDNAEHLLSACASLAAALIRSCPGVRVLATSREPLGIAGEQTYRVPTLTLPSASQAKAATPESLSQFESVRLFIERAQVARLDFAVTNANAPALAQVCTRLDGIPLAIELAAARVRSLAVEQINDKLDSRFRLLTGGDKSALPRQQTLRALIDWSYDLLTDGEKTLLARLSVFAGGWTLEAAESVCGFEPLEDWETLDLLTGLMDKSLILADEEEAGTKRYRMLETLRQYASEKREASGETADVQARHIAFFVALAEEARLKLQGPDQVVWLNRLETEHDNLRTALNACCAAAQPDMDMDTTTAAAEVEAALSGLRLSAALWRFWQTRGYFAEGREHLARALALRPAAAAAAASGRADAAVTVKIAVAGALRALGILANNQSDYAAARSQLEEGLGIFREIGDKNGIASALNGLGYVARAQGDYPAARSHYEECLSIFREIGNKNGIAISLGNLGYLACAQGDYAAARSQYEESLGVSREIGSNLGIAQGLEGITIVLGEEESWPLAVALIAVATALRASIGAPLPPFEQAELDAAAAKARAALSPSTFDAAWAEGTAMPWEQAVELALGKSVDAKDNP